MVNQSKTFVAPDKSKIETNRVSMFLFNENNDNNNDIKQNQNNININKNNEVKAPSSLFEGIEQPKEEKKEENQNIKPPNFLFDEDNKQSQKIEKPPTITKPQNQQNIPKAEVKPTKKRHDVMSLSDLSCCSATQNVFKYTQHIEKLKPSRVLLTASMCMLWWLQATHYSQVLVHSTVVNSCDSPQYTLTLA